MVAVEISILIETSANGIRDVRFGLCVGGLFGVWAARRLRGFAPLFRLIVSVNCAAV